MKNLVLLLILFTSCHLNIVYEVSFQFKTTSSSSIKIEWILTDGTQGSLYSSASGTYNLISRDLSKEDVTAADSNEAFRQLCPLPSAVISKINIYSVSGSGDSQTETLSKTILISDSEWIFSRMAQNIGTYTYELK